MFFLYGCTCAQQEAKTSEGKTVILYSDNTWVYRDSAALNYKFKPIVNLELPKTKPTDTIVSHSGFRFVYNEKHEQANWVAYFLTKERALKGTERTNNFKPDPKVSTLTANDKDYAASGYDRGHLAPAGDMTWSPEAMTESFYYSNMSPQEPSFNRGIWKKLEDQVRTWATQYDSIYIVTGPILVDGLPTIGANEVSIPSKYFKAILRYSSNSVNSIGFILPNKSSSESLKSFVIPIDSLEAITGFDFFYLLPDNIEHNVEKKISLENWSWKGDKTEKVKELK